MAVYGATAHGQEGCIGCHVDVEDPSIKHEEADQDLAPVDCGRCHEDAAAAYDTSIHANPRHRRPESDGEVPVTCVGCHGNHAIRGPKDPWSRVGALQQARTCGECHDVDRRAAGHPVVEAPKMPAMGVGPNVAPPRLVDDEGNDLVAASCSACHGGHAVHSATVARSMLYPARVTETCSTCHRDEADDFKTSAHDKAAHKEGFDWSEALVAAKSSDDGHAPHEDHEGHGAGGDSDPTLPPVCTTCHRMHQAAPPKTARFREDLVHECGTCHARLMETYVESYHGKATLLGDDTVAKCSDCHGFHGILGPDAPDSQVSPENKLETCQQCHADAPPGFASFYAHADHNDREGFAVLYWVYMFMTTLLVSVFSFFGLHTLLWAVREAIDAIRFRGRPRHIFKGPRIQRFSKVDRIIHFFVIISFLGLAATGAPLKFAEASWARGVLSWMGGVAMAGFLHRVFAVITFGYFFAHILQLAYNLLPELRRGRLIRTVLGPDSLVPRISDVTDVFAHFGWFLGLRKKPTWERWTYWEKFDYWAVFWGVAIIGSSGLVLWFPTFFTRLIPGLGGQCRVGCALR